MKIVIVEDEEETQKELASYITGLSTEYEVIGLASDGKVGLDLTLNLHPDLVLTDIEMPRTDGLTMLAELRKRKENCRAVIVTKHTEFDYIQRALCMGVENYLVKPINYDELAETLAKIYEVFIEEEEKDKVRSRFLSLEQIIRSLILAELPVDEELKHLLKDRYELEADDELGLLGIWLGSHFEEERERVVQVVESYTGKILDYRHVTIPSYNYRAVMIVLYKMNDPQKLYDRILRTMIPVFKRNLKYEPVFTWAFCDGISKLPQAFEKSINNRKWNLCLPECSLINVNEAGSKATIPISLTLQKEDDLRSIVAERNHKLYRRMINTLKNECMSQNHDPDEIHEICVRFCLAIIDESQVIGKVHPLISRQEVVSRLDHAVTWEAVEEVFEEVYDSVTANEDRGADLSPLIRRALYLIEESYAQGLTLDELARKLGVSQEYLSSQFRKETGLTFKETMRRYQITRVKELLLQSDLKLKNIAELSGYSDPKYMSKVFKEEVGMLPSEFRSRKR